MSPYLSAFLGITAVRLLAQVRAERRASRDARPTLHRGDDLRTRLMYLIYLLAWTTALRGLRVVSGSALQTGIGLGTMLSGMVLRLAALSALGSDFSSQLVIRREQRLATSGVYGVVRHPLHLGLLAEILGMCVVARSQPAWVIPLAAAVVVASRNKTEDRVLRESLGQPAVEYQARVPGMNLVLGIARVARDRYRRSGLSAPIP